MKGQRYKPIMPFTRCFLPLVQENQENDVISEHTQAMQGWHLDNKGKQVINDSVEELVCHLSPGQVSHTLQFVVQIQLRRKETAQNAKLEHNSAGKFKDASL